MSFLFPFLTFLQPGILWPEIADFKPMLMVSAIGLLIGLARRADYPRQTVFAHPIFAWFMAFMLAQALSLYRGGIGSMLNEFSFWLVYMLFVIVSILLISNAAALRRYVWGMITGGMVVVGYGIYGLYAWGGYTQHWMNQVSAAPSGRAGAYGMYENHNDYSFIIIQILPFIYMYMRAETGVFRRGLLGACLIAGVAAIFLSLSRGGAIALMLEFTLIVLIGMKGRRRLFLLPVLAAVGIAAVGYQFAMRAENQSGGYDVAAAESTRYELWRAARKMATQNPLLGVGSRRFGEYAKEYAELSHSQLGKNSHNTYLEILSTSGLIGLVSFVCMCYYLVRELRRRPKDTASPWLDATRIATLISFYSILFRAFLDAKTYDWSFYTLCAVGLACVALQRQQDCSAAKGKSAPRERVQSIDQVAGGARPG